MVRHLPVALTPSPLPNAAPPRSKLARFAAPDAATGTRAPTRQDPRPRRCCQRRFSRM